jgi:hypothetical protein
MTPEDEEDSGSTNDEHISMVTQASNTAGHLHHFILTKNDVSSYVLERLKFSNNLARNHY